MSVAISSHDTAIPPPAVPSAQDSSGEGDWLTYRQRCAEISQGGNDATYRSQARRALALAYLGRRAQWHGGVFSSTQPSVLTPIMVARLTETNTERRQQRYPWLAQLLSIVAELDREQHAQARLGGTVLTFPNTRRVEMQTS